MPIRLLVIFFFLAWLGCGSQSVEAVSDPLPGPSFEASFWSQWGDGRAELAGYDLTYPRYGELRQGTAVAIFVTETFDPRQRVKADSGEGVAVMKLNLAEDFPTGVYDYNQMTSSWATLQPAIGRPAGAPYKINLSVQEWCGQVFTQLLFRPKAVDRVSHSYFDGEADQQDELRFPSDGVPEDSLWLWARSFAAPTLGPGESQRIQLLPSLKRLRAEHEEPGWTPATLSRAAEPRTVTVPAGSFQVERFSAETEDGFRRDFFVETAAPRRIVRWETTEGETAEMLASERLQYWKMNAKEFEDAVKRLGLNKRPAHTM